MALSAEDKAEMQAVFADGFVAGWNKLRSQVEEEEAKKQAANPPTQSDKDGDKGAGFDVFGWILGK